MKAADLVSLSLVVAMLGPIAWWMWSGDLWYGLFSVGLIGANAVVAAVKRLCGVSGIFGRPVGAAGCDLLCMDGPTGRAPGFPSGHMTTAAMVVSGLWYHTGSATVLWIGIPWICAMGWSRWAKSCHNWIQVGAGTVFGWACGYAVGLY